MTLLIKNAVAPKNGELKPCSLFIKKDKIEKLVFLNNAGEEFDIIAPKSVPIMDAKGLLLMPGVIDPHVHLREPGLTEKEDLFTGSCAAAAGGVTTVFDMPNTNPTTTTVKALNQKRKLAQKMIVNYAFHFGGISGNESELKKVFAVGKTRRSPATKIYMNITTGKHIVKEDDALLKLFRASRIVAVHAEQETVSVALDLAKKSRKPLYCCHISTAKELNLIREARRAGQKVYCEVAPHHLFLTREDDKDGFTKMKPPLRRKSDQKALWNAIIDGTVDTIGTDHAPHTKKEKQGKVPAFGVPGLETSLPLMLTAVRDGKLGKTKSAISKGYEKIYELMCTNPAKIFGVIGRGSLKKGDYADFVLVDINKDRTVKGSALQTKCKWSPFEGMKLTGWPKYTFVNGNLIYDSTKPSLVKAKTPYTMINNIPASEVKFK